LETKDCLVINMKNNDRTYMQLVAWRDRLDEKQSQLHAELEDVSRKLESVSTTLALLDGSPMPISHNLALAENTLPPPVSIDVTGLRGMTQVEALTKIAEHNGGQIQTLTAKKILLQAGLIKNPKNANNILFSVIQRSGKFERVDHGVYRLVGHKPERPEKKYLVEPPPLPSEH
jgi:hypothetical protein